MHNETPSRYALQAQARVKHAWQWVDEVQETFKNEKEKGARLQSRYATLARKLPGYLQVSGLGQTMAFLHAKSSDEENTVERLLYQQLSDFLCKQLGMQPGDLMKVIVMCEPSQYRRATREAVQVADWLKRFVEGRLEPGSQG